MRTYVALLDGGRREVAVGVTRLAPGRYEVHVGDEVHVVDAFEHDYGTLSLLVGTRSYAATLDVRGARTTVRVKGSAFPLELLDEKRLRLRRAAARTATEGRQAIAAALPGKVVKVLVKVGDLVRAGEALLVVETVRMESVVRSPKAGRLVELHVQQGQAVESRATLCVVE